MFDKKQVMGISSALMPISRFDFLLCAALWGTGRSPIRTEALYFVVYAALTLILKSGSQIRYISSQDSCISSARFQEGILHSSS